MSGHHHMIYTMLKSTIEKAEPIKLIYRDYKNFSFDRFKADLKNALKSKKKTKRVRGNNKQFLRRAIMRRSKSKNKANKTKHLVDIKMYKKQRNHVVGLNKQAKFKYFNNLDRKKDAKPVWDKCKPYFSNKHGRGGTNVILKEKGKILLKNDVIANTFSNFFLLNSEIY